MDKSYSGATRCVYEVIHAFPDAQHQAFTMAINTETAHKNHLHYVLARKKYFGNQITKRLNFARKADQFMNQQSYDLVVGHGDNLKQDILFLHNCIDLAYELMYEKPIAQDNPMHLLHSMIIEKGMFQRVVANSHLMKADLIHRYHIPEDKIDIVYPGFSPAIFYVQSEENIQQQRTALGISPDEVVVGFVTSGDFRKRGVDKFVNLICQLPESLKKKVKFLIVGKGEIKHFARAEMIANIISLPITQNIQDIYNIIDIFLYPARIEEFGLVVSEAMACGCPVLTTQNVGASEIFTGDARFGICGDSKEMQEKLVALIQDKTLRQKMSVACQASSRQVTEAEFAKNFKKVAAKVTNR